MNYDLETRPELRISNSKTSLSSNNDLGKYTDKTQRNKELVIAGNKPREKKNNIAQEIRMKLRYNKEGLCINAFDIATSPEVLKIAYETIKSKSGNTVRGSDTETLDGIS
jgi:hypothetical protein